MSIDETDSRGLRKPVAAWPHDFGRGVVCDDGSVWSYVVNSELVGGWSELPPVPGTRRAVELETGEVVADILDSTAGRIAALRPSPEA